MSFIPSAQSSMVKEEIESRASLWEKLRFDISMVLFPNLKILLFTLVIVNLIQTIIIIINEAPNWRWGDSFIEIIKSVLNLLLTALLWPYWYQLALFEYYIKNIFE
jgi:hypothetical protein